MPASRLYLPLVIIAAACSEAAPTAVEAPTDLAPAFDLHYGGTDDNPDDGPLRALALTECGSQCTIKVGETQLVAWVITNGGAAVMDIRSPAQIAFVIGGTDTIPGPPAPGPVRRAIRNVGPAAFTLMMESAGFGTDTIPGPPPAPFVYRSSNGDALMLFSVDDMMNKGVLRQTSMTSSTSLEVVWTTGSGQNTQSWSAAGLLPPTDTIPGPPPAPERTRGK